MTRGTTVQRDRGKPRLVYVVTHPVSADTLLRGQLAFMREHGFDVTVITSPGRELERVRAREGVQVVTVPMARPIRPRVDGESLVRLAAVLRRLQPDIVNASTPKAGLLGMLAARATGVPHRVYLLRGLRLETTTGSLRRVLGATERIASACAHDVVCVSRSLRDAAVRGGFVPASKALLVGKGSSNGVDIARWERSPERVARGRELARSLAIEDDDLVIGFVGRLDRDKGIGELLDAFAQLRRARSKTKLLLVGVELADDTDEELAARVRNADGVAVIGRSEDLAPIYARMDVLAFPSYREGFPNVPLEAACARVPVVGFRSTGVVDAVVDGETGMLVGRGDVSALRDALARYLDDAELRRSHGEAGRLRAAATFSREVVWRAWEEFYRSRLARIE